jgi:hypothetical protein
MRIFATLLFLCFCLLFSVLVIAGAWMKWGGGTSGLPDDAFQAEADSVSVMAIAGFRNLESSPDQPSPDRKVGDKCDNCGGSGRSGDGLGRCNVCGGDGKIDKQDLRSSVTATVAPKNLVKPEPTKVVIYVPEGYASGWLVDFWRTHKTTIVNKYPDLDIKVDRLSSKEPWMKVCGSVTCASILGEVPLKEFESVLEKVNQ